MIWKTIWTGIAVCGLSTATAQHQETHTAPNLWKGKEQPADDTTSLLHAFRNGQVSGHFRYFFMATDNRNGLTDFHAHAAGGGIKFETARFKGFQFGVSGFFTFNVGSSNLGKPDPTTNQISRYEIGLFDLENPGNRDDIDRLEELYLKYSWKKAHITLGKQLLNTPFINLQDGRMRPTEVGGLFMESRDVKNTRIEGGYLYELSPRGTVKWFRIAESIGVYPSGVSPSGKPSAYKDHLRSGGIGLLGISHKLSEKHTVKLYDVFVDNIFNTLLLQADQTWPVGDKQKLVSGLQWIRQQSINHGGNEDPARTYMEKGGQSQVFGARFGWENNRWKTSLNYTRITARGRYLMPREWGVEPFYTFMPRERNEGFGDVHAYVLKAGYDLPKLRLKTQASAGYFNLPDVMNYRLNKYGLPSYTQFNVDVRYTFTGLLRGMETQLLYVHKGRQGETYGNDRFVINKVNMSLWNLVINYYF